MDVTILSLRVAERTCKCFYELHLEERCIKTCHETVVMTTMYANVTSYILDAILSGKFTSIFRANSREYGGGHASARKAEVTGGSFGEEETAVLTKQPSQKPTRRKRTKKNKSQKKSRPKTTVTRRSGKPKSKTKRSGRMCETSRGKRTCGGVRNRSHIPVTTPLLSEEDSFQNDRYFPLRKRIRKADDRQVKTYVLAQLEEEGNISDAMEVSLPENPTVSSINRPTSSTANVRGIRIDRKRKRESSPIAKFSTSSKLSSLDVENMKYEPVRIRGKKSENENMVIGIDESQQVG